VQSTSPCHSVDNTTSLPRNGPSPATSSRPSRTTLLSTTASLITYSSKAFTDLLPILRSSMRKTRILNHSNRKRKVGYAAIITTSPCKRVQEHAFMSKGSRSTKSAKRTRQAYRHRLDLSRKWLKLMRRMHQYVANRNVFRDCLKLFPPIT